ncbi:MAG: hypothetical protein ACE5GE_16750 [Phycisphaerae bacterium]
MTDDLLLLLAELYHAGKIASFSVDCDTDVRTDRTVWSVTIFCRHDTPGGLPKHTMYDYGADIVRVQSKEEFLRRIREEIAEALGWLKEKR